MPLMTSPFLTAFLGRRRKRSSLASHGTRLSIVFFYPQMNLVNSRNPNKYSVHLFPLSLSLSSSSQITFPLKSHLIDSFPIRRLQRRRQSYKQCISKNMIQLSKGPLACVCTKGEVAIGECIWRTGRRHRIDTRLRREEQAGMRRKAHHLRI